LLAGCIYFESIETMTQSVNHICYINSAYEYDFISLNVSDFNFVVLLYFNNNKINIMILMTILLQTSFINISNILKLFG